VRARKKDEKGEIQSHLPSLKAKTFRPFPEGFVLSPLGLGAAVFSNILN